MCCIGPVEVVRCNRNLNSHLDLFYQICAAHHTLSTSNIYRCILCHSCFMANRCTFAGKPPPNGRKGYAWERNSARFEPGKCLDYSGILRRISSKVLSSAGSRLTDCSKGV